MRKLILMAIAFALLTAPAWADWIPEDGHKMHFPQMPDEAGWSVLASVEIALADDWQCSETGEIKDFHFWGSWKDMNNDQIGDVGELASFFVYIYDNIPEPPSRPGNEL